MRSSLAYDSIYTPVMAGSGGSGASGGGVLHFNINDLFRVEGNIRANGGSHRTGGKKRFVF